MIIQAIENDGSERIKEFWGMTVYEARKFFIKPILKSMIKSGLTAKEIAEKFNIDTRTLSEWIKEFWNMSLREARKYLI